MSKAKTTKQKQSARPLWTWDIESTDWDRPVCVVATSTAGDVERFWGPDSVERVDDLMRKAKGQWIAHAGGIYDTLLLMNARERPFPELILSGSAILCARDGALRVRDSFRWWLSSLKAVGEYVDRLDGGTGRFLKKDVDRTAIERLTQQQTLDYCESDCRILLEGVQRCSAWMLEQGARPAWTSGSSALSLLQTLEPFGWRVLESHALSVDMAERARECVRGARVEDWAAGRIARVFPYDFKSAYPAAYIDRPLGLGCREAAPGERGEHTVWRVRWFWPHRHVLPPVLDQETNAGAGWCEAWCCHDEIEDLEAAGVGLQFLRGYAAEVMAPIGQVFARTLYTLKEGGAFWAKVFLNSLHGKFSENPIREAWRSDKKPETWHGPDPELVGSYWHFFQQAGIGGMAPRHVQPLAAAMILGRQRSRLYRLARALLAAGERIYYADTDSMFASCDHARIAAIAARDGSFSVGKELGQLAPEGGPFEGLFLGPKAYCLCDPASGAPLKGALKGVPWKSLKDGVIDSAPSFLPIFRQARGEEQGRDLRRALFEQVLARGRVLAQKEGISTFLTGLKAGERWGKLIGTRTIQQQHRNKVFRDGSADVWAYRTPAEVRARMYHVPDDVDDRDDTVEQIDLPDAWQ